MPTRLVLVGAGHPHLYVLEGLARSPAPPDAVLVTPGRDKVFGPLVGGVVSGQVARAAATIDLVRLADAAGARFLQTSAVRLDPDARLVHLEDGNTLPYDLLSIAVGGCQSGTGVEGSETWGHRLDSFDSVGHCLAALDTLPQSGEAPPRVVIAGGTTWTVELALAIRHRLRDRAIVTLLHTHQRPSESARGAALEADPARPGISRIFGAVPARVEENRIILGNGARVPFDFLLWANDPDPPILQRSSGLPADGRGFFLVDRYLRSTAARNVFVSGGAAALAGDSRRPNAGQVPLDHGPILWHNLSAALAGKEVSRRAPMGAPLLALHRDGAGRGFLQWGSLKIRAGLAVQLGERRIQKLLRRFQEIHRPAMSAHRR